jgi:site-specific recombinase XerD
MYTLLQSYLSRLPGSLREEEVTAEDGSTTKVTRCVYTPHSLRATTATLLLDAGVDIIKVEELLGHRHVTTTQIYDKRRRSLKERASHDVLI